MDGERLVTGEERNGNGERRRFCKNGSARCMEGAVVLRNGSPPELLANVSFSRATEFADLNFLSSTDKGEKASNPNTSRKKEKNPPDRFYDPDCLISIDAEATICCRLRHCNNRWIYPLTHMIVRNSLSFFFAQLGMATRIITL